MAPVLSAADHAFFEANGYLVVRAAEWRRLVVGHALVGPHVLSGLVIDLGDAIDEGGDLVAKLGANLVESRRRVF